MVGVYTTITILWLFVWQILASRLIGLKLREAVKDIVPYFIISVGIMCAIYFSTGFINNLILLLIARIILSAVLYLLIMKLCGSKILQEIIAYLGQRRVR